MLPSFHSLLYSNSILAAACHRDCTECHSSRRPAPSGSGLCAVFLNFLLWIVFPWKVSFLFPALLWYKNRKTFTSLQKDFGMRQGGSHELLSTGGFIAGQPPAGQTTAKSNGVCGVIKKKTLVDVPSLLFKEQAWCFHILKLLMVLRRARKFIINLI